MNSDASRSPSQEPLSPQAGPDAAAATAVQGADAPSAVAAALAAAMLVKALEKGEKPLSRALGWLFLLSAAAPISWMLLAKEHSALHAHLTPMLWNFALVPVCGAALGCAAEALARRLIQR